MLLHRTNHILILLLYNSIINQIDYLTSLLNSNTYSIVCLVETNINFTNIDLLLLFNIVDSPFH